MFVAGRTRRCARARVDLSRPLRSQALAEVQWESGAYSSWVSAKVLGAAPRKDFSFRSQSASEFLNKATSSLTCNMPSCLLPLGTEFSLIIRFSKALSFTPCFTAAFPLCHPIPGRKSTVQRVWSVRVLDLTLPPCKSSFLSRPQVF